MTPLDLIAVFLVCATALSWHAISRHYARRDAAEVRRHVDAALSHMLGAEAQASFAEGFAKCADLAAKEATKAAETATSAAAQRNHDVVLARLHELEARIGMRRG